MNLHEADIKARLSRFLDRKQMPRRLEGKPEAGADEIRALVAAIARNAPRTAERLAEWWPAFEAALGEVCGSMWPTEKEIRDAAQGLSRTMPMVTVSDLPVIDMTPIAINARRMARGEAVGESYLYGIVACELIAKRLVDEDTMQRYRRGAYEARKEVYGADKAEAWKAEQEQKHAAAAVVWKARSGAYSAARPTIVSPKTFGTDVNEWE